MTIRGRINNRPWAGYLDLAQLQSETHYALAGFFLAHAPTSASVEHIGVRRDRVAARR